MGDRGEGAGKPPTTQRIAADAVDILAVVVSYNGLTSTKETVEALRRQVGLVCIVDNGSEAPSLEMLATFEGAPGVSVVRLGANYGIGHALNIGVARARDLGCTWLLTMDHDSVIQPGMIQAYRSAIAAHPELVSVSPCIAGLPVARDNELYVVGSAITSGNLVKVSLFDEVGPYDESLFIDCVDFDFCLRVRRAGHAIHRVSAALMSHQLGEGREDVTVLKRFYAEHSPLRRYYMSRNFLYLTERNVLRFPLFILKLTAAHIVLLVLVGFNDPHRLASYRAVLRGIWDYLARKHGPYRGRTP